jgi:hypothetical protein
MKVVTIADAAAALGISPVRMRQLCQQGRVHGAEKIGRDWMVPVGPDERPRVEEKETTRGPQATWAAAEPQRKYGRKR